ncbi:MAG: D-alanyl-D-alanine carboxypeptidase [Oscillospiraceae bacterium]|nr:D-alanyl-D-alanine carboxypeptidase [Oscillospiraceae bacterium]
MKKSKILSYILALAVINAVFAPISAAALSDPEPASRAVVLADTETGGVLYAKGGDEQVYPASTTKIMTVLLAVEAVENGRVSLSDAVTASGNITAGLTEDGSTAGIVPGETMSLEDLLYCAMLASANEACNVIAEHVGGSVSAFVGMMNERAGTLGCSGTNFTNTHGLPDYNHYTTANDLALVALEAFSHPLFMEICNAAGRTIPATNVAEERRLSNTNGLINSGSEAYPGYYYAYAKGIKTGHTQDAGYCLVSAAEKGDVSLLCVVMGGMAVTKVEKTDFTNFTDSIAMYDWGFENFAYRDILDTTDLIRDLPVKMGRDSDYVTVRPETAVRALMAVDEDNSGFEQSTVIYSEKNGEALVAPIEAGAVLGEISISRDGRVYGSSRLVAASSVDVSYSLLIRSKIAESFSVPVVLVCIAVFALFIGYIVLIIRYRRSKKAYMARVKARRGETKPAQAAKAAEPHGSPEPEAPDGGARAAQDPGETGPELQRETQAERDYFDEFFGRNGK